MQLLASLALARVARGLHGLLLLLPVERVQAQRTQLRVSQVHLAQSERGIGKRR